ncbi:helix-turn-helix domain-containing protein [Priestia koreensis]|uniref:helix-turn-helix domain-containing protein n=1 Tax=Priestia koreensis TaxID=284581 RepID=UPI00203EA38D|nr:helix-turn-helix domain-containing protein [Priestia koreensis]MCM3005863.1 helix-turn-helix domain-containing protein [Priestia koreensis]
MKNDEQRDLLDTHQAAELLGVEASTIHKYVREEKLKPVHHFRSRVHHRNQFYKEDVLALKTASIKPGLTTGEVSKALNIHPTTVAKYIREGKLQATKHYYNGRNLFFISEEEINRFKNEETDPLKSFFTNDKRFLLYQSFIHPSTGEFGRILSIDGKDFIFKTDRERELSRIEVEKEGFQPVYEGSTRPYIKKKGYVRFQFLQPSSLNDNVYRIIDRFYKEVGAANIKIDQSSSTFIGIEVKPCTLPLTYEENVHGLYQHELDILRKGLTAGDIVVEERGIKIIPDLEPLTLFMPAEIKNNLKKEAANQQMTMEEWVLKKIYPFLEEK